jgi:hypothetical protein
LELGVSFISGIDDLPWDLVWLHSGLQKPSRSETQRGQRKGKRISTTDNTDFADGILFIGRGGKLNAKAQGKKIKIGISGKDKTHQNFDRMNKMRGIRQKGALHKNPQCKRTIRGFQIEAWPFTSQGTPLPGPLLARRGEGMNGSAGASPYPA